LGPRERRLLIGLVAVTGLAVLVRWGGADANPLVDAGARGRGSAAGPEEAPVREVVPLDVGALRPHEGRFEVGRDPFRYGPIPTPPPPPPPPPAPPPPPIVEVAPPPPPRPPVPQPPSSSHLRFLGSFGPADRRIAVVLSGEELHNVREGAVLEGRFVVQEIGYESLAIAFVGFPDAPPVRLPAGGSG
jgi:hypothetical protein